ncbi:MAG TPA: hypothetical protein VFM09_07500 [Marmoricola sp.]|nr:hypothetical protein [Marmoricola sp.]
MDDHRWLAVAERQHGVMSRLQLRDLGVTRSTIRAHVRARRWTWRTESVLTITTGPLSWPQRLWVAVLHAGPGSLVGGLTAARVHGLRHWDRDDVTVLVRSELSFDPVPGVRFFRTRRPLDDWGSRLALPTCRIEPAILLQSAYERHPRTAHGAIAAVVQQRLSTPERLRHQLEQMHPLRRAGQFRSLLLDLAGGAQSVAEVDVRRACRRCGVVPPARQRPRLDRSGRQRWTDCEWDLPDGVVVVLEVDGAHHAEVRQYNDDIRRQRKLTTRRRILVRCSAYEVRHDPDDVMEDLIALGVPRTRRVVC